MCMFRINSGLYINLWKVRSIEVMRVLVGGSSYYLDGETLEEFFEKPEFKGVEKEEVDVVIGINIGGEELLEEIVSYEKHEEWIGTLVDNINILNYQT